MKYHFVEYFIPLFFSLQNIKKAYFRNFEKKNLKSTRINFQKLKRAVFKNFFICCIMTILKYLFPFDNLNKFSSPLIYVD